MEARLDAPATFPAKSNHRFPLRSCCECGETFAPANLEAEFCGERCRKVFNNRRMQRGAEIYDLIMALRYDRKTATALKVWTLVFRLCSIFRSEDKRDRAGRLSWRAPARIIERRPYLRAEMLHAGSRPH